MTGKEYISLSAKDYRKKFAKNNPAIALNVLYDGINKYISCLHFKRKLKL